MKIENYKAKLENMLLHVQLIDEKLAKLKKIREANAAKNCHDYRLDVLYFSLFNEKYDLHDKIGKLQRKFKDDGFELRLWCEVYNYYIDLFRDYSDEPEKEVI